MSDIEVIKTNNYYKIPSGKDSPEVIFNWKDKTLKIEGLSLMADAYSFYGSLRTLLLDLFDRFHIDKLQVFIHYYYVNTHSLKHIVSFLSTLEKFGKNCKIYWYYSDEEINELGQNLNELIDIDFEFIYKPSDKNLFEL